MKQAPIWAENFQRLYTFLHQSDDKGYCLIYSPRKEMGSAIGQILEDWSLREGKGLVKKCLQSWDGEGKLFGEDFLPHWIEGLEDLSGKQALRVLKVLLAEWEQLADKKPAMAIFVSPSLINELEKQAPNGISAASGDPIFWDKGKSHVRQMQKQWGLERMAPAGILLQAAILQKALSEEGFSAESLERWGEIYGGLLLEMGKIEALDSFLDEHRSSFEEGAQELQWLGRFLQAERAKAVGRGAEALKFYGSAWALAKEAPGTPHWEFRKRINLERWSACLLQWEQGDQATKLLESRLQLALNSKDENPGFAGSKRDIVLAQTQLLHLEHHLGKEEQLIARKKALLEILEETLTWQEDQIQALATWVQAASQALERGRLQRARTFLEKTILVFQKLEVSCVCSRTLSLTRAVALEKWGLICQKEGKEEEARGFFLRHLEAFQDLSDADPAQLNLRSGLAGAHFQLGQWARKQGKAQEALQSFNEAIRLQAEIFTCNQKKPESMAILSHYSEVMADFFRDYKAWKDALAYGGQSLRLREDLLALLSDSELRKADRAKAFSGLGDTYFRGGDYQMARRNYLERLYISRDLIKGAPDSTIAMELHAVSLAKMGNIYEAEGYLPEASKHMQEDYELCQKLAERFPNLHKYQKNKMLSAIRYAFILEKRGYIDTLKSLKPEIFRECRELWQKSHDPQVGAWLQDIAQQWGFEMEENFSSS